MNKNNNDDENTSKYVFSSIYLLGKYLGIGWILVTPTVLFTFGGKFLDNQFNLGYFMTLLGLMIGLFIGIIVTVRILKS